VSELDRADMLRLRHRVRVVHGGTGEPYERIVAGLEEPAWPHWVLRTRGADVLLSAHDDLAGTLPPTTKVSIRIADPELGGRFALGTGSATVTLASGADQLKELVLDPAPASLEVRLRGASGAPATDLTVEARAAGNGETVPLAETPASSGVYSAGPRDWKPKPYAIEVAGQARRSILIDPWKSVTRVQFTYP
jgi:hypothetical protein